MPEQPAPLHDVLADADQLMAAFADALPRMSVASIPGFHERLTRATRAALAGDTHDLTEVVRGVVVEDRLWQNPEYLRASKEFDKMMLEPIGPDEKPLDARALIDSLRGSR